MTQCLIILIKMFVYGDFLFKGTIGRYDLPTGDFDTNEPFRQNKTVSVNDDNLPWAW